jgi:hypothetical protein
MSTSETDDAAAAREREGWVRDLARLTEAVERDPDPAACPDEVVQRLLGLAVRLYAAKRDAGEALAPFVPGCTLTATEVGATVVPMLRAADVELFELAMWQHLIDPE